MSPTSRLTGKAILSSVDHRSTSWGGGRKGTAAYRTCHGAWLTITKRGDITAKGLGIMSVMHETSYNAMRRDFYARFASSTCASLLALARCRYSIFIIRIVRFSCPDFVLIRFKSLSHWRSSLLWEFDEHSWQLTATQTFHDTPSCWQHRMKYKATNKHSQTHATRNTHLAVNRRREVHVSKIWIFV